MSKKKSFSGSTMTLKDFHGGSIPSDLLLPSAPGVSARQSDRAGVDRPIGGSWGAAGRIDHYRPVRPGSAGGVGGGTRAFVEETAPFLPHSTRIGRNFEEDERKPFEASSAPRRLSVAIDTDRLPRLGTDVTTQQQNLGRPGSSPAVVTNFSSGGPHFQASGFSSSPQSTGFLNGGSSVPNAWGVRKEVSREPQAQSATTWSGPAAASRFAQASALEKISSGRWQSKHVVFSQTPNAEVMRFSEMDEGGTGFQEHGVVYGGGTEQRYDGKVDRSYTSSVDEHNHYRRITSPVYPDAKERDGALGFGTDMTHPEANDGRYDSPLVHQHERRSDSVQALQQGGGFTRRQVHQLDGRLGGLQVSQQGGRFSEPQGFLQEEGFNVSQLSETTERPKLKLLPRTMQLEASEMQVSDATKGNHSPSVDTGNVESIHEAYANQQPVKPGSSGSDGENRLVERPRLNLKPRSKSLEQSAASIERERNMLFGGARPRELVLKERGCDNAAVILNQSQPDNRRAKHDMVKMDVKPEFASSPNWQSERTESYSHEHRGGRNIERKDHQTDREKVDALRSSWKNDSKRNVRENERPSDQRPEPESWRRPVEQPKSDIPSPHHGKTASALELTQVYSRSASETRFESRLTKQSSGSGRSQVPFSRLMDNQEFHTGSNPRKINGY